MSCVPEGSTPSPDNATSLVLGSELNAAPQILAANQTYGPAYSVQAAQNLNSYLTGPNGFLSLYQNQIAPAAAASQVASNSAVRAGNVADVNALIPGMTTATRAANPQAASLLDSLTSSAQNDLGLGTRLNPAETTMVQQAVRGGQQARGFGNGASDVLQEALAQQDYGQQLYQQRRQNAGQAAGQAENFYGGIVPTILSGQSNPGVASNLTATGTGAAAPAMSNEFNPTPMATNFMDTQAQTSNNNAALRVNATNTGVNASAGMLGSL